MQFNDSIPLEIEPDVTHTRHSEGAFVTLNDGRILFAWSKFRGGQGGDHDPSDIVARTSRDGGQNWDEEERVLARPEGAAHNVMSVSLLRLQNGRIVLLYLEKENLPNGRYSCRPIVRFSDDEMATLSAPRPVTPSTDYHVVNNDRLIQLRDGTLLIPVGQHRFGLAKDGSLRLQKAALIFYFLSHDNGATWMESANNYYRCFADGSGLQEPGAIELNDGRIWSWTRTAWRGEEESSRQWQAFSSDGGRVWSAPEPSVFVSPCSPLSMKRIPQSGDLFAGDLFAVWNDHSGRVPFSQQPDFHNRSPLVCARSSDEGATWHSHRVLEDSAEHGFCYTAIHFTADAVLLAYCAGGPRPQNCLQRLRMRRILLSDLS